MNVRLEFENKYGDLVDLGEFKDRDEAWQFMRCFIDANKLTKMYYARAWEEGNKMKIDYGSHFSFFYMSYVDNSKFI